MLLRIIDIIPYSSMHLQPTLPSMANIYLLGTSFSSPHCCPQISFKPIQIVSRGKRLEMGDKELQDSLSNIGISLSVGDSSSTCLATPPSLPSLTPISPQLKKNQQIKCISLSHRAVCTHSYIHRTRMYLV
jgi:hypothetical protein